MTIGWKLHEQWTKSMRRESDRFTVTFTLYGYNSSFECCVWLYSTRFSAVCDHTALAQGNIYHLYALHSFFLLLPGTAIPTSKNCPDGLKYSNPTGLSQVKAQNDLILIDYDIFYLINCIQNMPCLCIYMTCVGLKSYYKWHIGMRHCTLYDNYWFSIKMQCVMIGIWANSPQQTLDVDTILG